MLKFRLSESSSRPSSIFDEEPEPRNWLLAGMLDDHFYEGDIAMLLSKIAKAEAGEPNVVSGNHEVWVIMSANKVVIEEMLYDEDRTNGTVPKRTEISLAEAKQLVLEWQEAVKRWYTEHREDHDSAASTPVRSYLN